jgi:hypothetical protein
MTSSSLASRAPQDDGFVREPNVNRPAVGADPHRLAALMDTAVDAHTCTPGLESIGAHSHALRGGGIPETRNNMGRRLGVRRSFANLSPRITG